MAIKDSLISDILKTGNNHLASKHLYKRLRPDVESTIEKQNTNWAQTGHKLDTEQHKNGTQTGHKQNTNLLPLTNLKNETEHKPDTKLNTQPDTNQIQTGH